MNRAEASGSASMMRVFDALGNPEFDAELLGFLNQNSGVEHFTVYQIADRPQIVGGASMHGPHAALADGGGGFRTRDRSYSDLEVVRVSRTANSALVREDPLRTDDIVLRDAFHRYEIVDRLLLFGRRQESWFGLSLLRSRELGNFNDTCVDAAADLAGCVISAIAKHAAIRRERRRVADALVSVPSIEDVLRAADVHIPSRERQVIARILFGISVLGIACDLNLSEETVATYRKRAYQRLSISSRHELLQFYLKLVCTIH